MPLKIKRKFEKEYGKKEGDRIFYAWENKHKSKGGVKMKGKHHHIHYHIHYHGIRARARKASKGYARRTSHLRPMSAMSLVRREARMR
jgi:hypothetical protein